MFEADDARNSGLLAALRQALLRLADAQDQQAASEAAKVPYWTPLPASVVGHRAAAHAIRVDADKLLRNVA